MAFIMPFTAFYLFKLIKKLFRNEKGQYIAAFLAAYISVNAAALAAAVEFGIQPLLFKDSSGLPLYSPYGMAVSISTMMIPHLLVVGILEGLITAGAYSYIKKASPELIYSGKVEKTKFLYIIIGILILAAPLGLLADGTAWGEWGSKEIKNIIGFVPKGMKEGFKFRSLIPGYGFGAMNKNLAYILSASAGVIIILIAFKVLEKINLKKNIKGD